MSLKAVVSLDGRQLQNLLINELRKAAEETTILAIPGIKRGVGPLIEIAINSSPQISVWENRFRGQVGVIDIRGAVDAIIDAVIKNTDVSYDKTYRRLGTIFIRLDVGILKDDFSDILSLHEASFISEGGFLINWLEWFLLGGGVQVGYEYMDGNFRKSRTGEGIMFKSKAGNWETPTELEGSKDDNFLVRALTTSTFNANLGDLIQDQFQAVLI